MYSTCCLSGFNISFLPLRKLHAGILIPHAADNIITNTVTTTIHTTTTTDDVDDDVMISFLSFRKHFGDIPTTEA